MTTQSTPARPARRTRPQRLIQSSGAFVVYAVRRFLQDGLSQSAASLTYSTLLALVPLAVIAFAVLSNFAAFDTAAARLEQLFLDAIVPEVGEEIRRYFEAFTGNARNLTAAGIVGLAVTAVLLLANIETALNQVWRVQRPRTWTSRILIYWAVLTLGPLLLGASFTLSGDVLERLRLWGAGAEVMGRLERSGGAAPMILAVLTQTLLFTLLYKVVPARSVHVTDAAVGGLVAAIAFVGLRWGFNSFVTSGSTYQTIYGAVAVVPIFLLWLYACWTVVILGAVVAAALPDWWNSRDPLIGVEMPPPLRLQLAVAVLSVLASRARSGDSTHPDELKDRILIDARDEVVDRLHAAGYVAVTEAGRLVLVRDLHATTLGALVADLGLSLTAPPPEAEADPEGRRALVLAEIARLSGGLPERLVRLSAAEAQVLNVPVAEILAESVGPAA